MNPPSSPPPFNSMGRSSSPPAAPRNKKAPSPSTEVPPLGLLSTPKEATDEACPLDLDEADDAWQNQQLPSPSSQHSKGPRKGERKLLGKPKHPLNAYNLFFYIMRQRLLQKFLEEKTETGYDPNWDGAHHTPQVSFVITEADVARYFPYPEDDNHFCRSLYPKPLHFHLTFKCLGQFVGQAWRRLDMTSKAILQRRAQRYSDDYRVAMVQWNQAEKEALQMVTMHEMMQREVDLMMPATQTTVTELSEAPNNDTPNETTAKSVTVPHKPRGKVLPPRPPASVTTEESLAKIPQARRGKVLPPRPPTPPTARRQRLIREERPKTKKMRYVTPEPTQLPPMEPQHYSQQQRFYQGSVHTPARQLTAAEHHQLLTDPMPLMTWHPPPVRPAHPADMTHILHLLTGEVQRLSQHVSQLTGNSDSLAPSFSSEITRTMSSISNAPPPYTRPASSSGFAQYVRPDPSPRRITWMPPPQQAYGPTARLSRPASSEWWSVEEWRAIHAARGGSGTFPSSWDEEEDEGTHPNDGKPPAG